MEETRQYSAVMSKRVKRKFAALALANATFFSAGAGFSSTFPEILIEGGSWKAEAGEYASEFDQKDTSLPVVLIPPSNYEFFDADQIVKQTLFSACNEIMKRPDQFATNGKPPLNIDFVHFVVRRGEQELYPYPLGYRISEGKCTGSISFVMPDLSDRFSGHSELDELIAILNSWGLGLPILAFETGTQGKAINAEIEWLSEFGRDLKTLFPVQQCVHSLANLEEEVVFLGVPIRPKNYPRIDIEVVEVSSFSIFSRTNGLAAVSFAVRDGQCVPLEEEN